MLLFVFVKESKLERFSVCGGCQSVCYCSRNLQFKGWNQHQVLCKAISRLFTKSKENIHKAGVYNTTLVPSERDRVVQLIGEKCLFNCKINGIKTMVLLDTGAQVSLIIFLLTSNAWLNTCLHEHKVSKIDENLDPCDKLKVQWGNQADILFGGWVDIIPEFTGHGNESSQRLQILFLVIQEVLHQPILGFNAIKILANKSDNTCAIVNSFTSNNFW